MAPRRIALALATLAAALGGLSAAPPASGASAGQFRQGHLIQSSPGTLVAVGREFAVARTAADGTSDPSFGSDGVARARFPAFEEAVSIDAARQAHGGIVVGGYVVMRCRERRRHTQCPRRGAVVRFDGRGGLDPGFGNRGRVLLPRGWTVNALLRLPSGKLLISGRNGEKLPVLARLVVDGRLDRSFGAGDGSVVVRRLPEGPPLSFGRLGALAPAADGATTASIFAFGPHLREHGLVRFGRQGALDTSFGDRGFADAAPAGTGFHDSGFSFVTLPDNQILVASKTDVYPQRIALFRLLPDGEVDRSYGVEGLAAGPASFGVRFNVDLALLPDGGAVAGAAGFLGSAVARFGPSGLLDASFGSDGLSEALPSWGSHASVALLGDSTVALADANRQLSDLLVGRFDAEGRLSDSFELLRP
jgi:uncharacterized delta-60 repeat protein